MQLPKKYEGKSTELLSQVLITGGTGMVGNYVDFGTKLSHNELDITKRDVVFDKVRGFKPKVILHLAALTDLDFAEKNPAEAYYINTTGTYHVALAAREVGAKMVYVSTAGVFDGEKAGSYDEHDEPNPQNIYGHSKYLGELIVQSLLSDFLIVRACWMFGGGPRWDKKFVSKIIAQLDKPEIYAIRDSYGSPTFGKDLAAGLRILIERDETGIIHMGGRGQASRYDLAKAIVETLKPGHPVIPVGADYFKNLSAVRVRNEVLSSRVTLMRPWQEALKEYLEAEWIPVLSMRQKISI